MSTFQKLNEFLVSPMTLREGKVYRLPIKSLPSAGFLCSVSIEGGAIEAAFEDVSGQKASELVDPSSAVIGGAFEQFLVINAKAHGVSTLVLRHSRPWLADDELAQTIRIEVQVVSEEIQQAWEDAVPVPPVSDAEIRRLLDRVDGSKPYGSKKCALARKALDIFAKDVAVHRHAGKDYELADWKVKGFSELFPAALLPRAYNIREALQEFVDGRIA